MLKIRIAFEFSGRPAQKAAAFVQAAVKREFGDLASVEVKELKGPEKGSWAVVISAHDSISLEDLEKIFQ